MHKAGRRLPYIGAGKSCFREGHGKIGSLEYDTCVADMIISPLRTVSRLKLSITPC